MALLKRVGLTLVITLLGGVVGYVVVLMGWDLTHPDRAREDFTGEMVGLVFGTSLGGIAGLALGFTLATRWIRSGGEKRHSHP